MTVPKVETGGTVEGFRADGFFRKGERLSRQEQAFTRQLVRELLLRPDPPKLRSDVSIHPWQGLSEVTDGEMRYELSPIKRLAFMITQTDFKKAALEVLIRRPDNGGMKLLLSEMAKNIAAELVLNGSGDKEHNLTERQCSLLRSLIGIGDNGKQQQPKTVDQLSSYPGKDGRKRFVDEKVAPMMRFIREEFGEEIIVYIDRIRKDEGILVAL